MSKSIYAKKDETYELPLEFSSCDFDYYIFENCTFKSGLIFREINIHKGIRLINCIFSGDIEIIKCTSDELTLQYARETILIDNCTIASRLLITGEESDGKMRATAILKGICIKNKTTIEKLDIYGLYSAGLEIDDVIISQSLSLRHSKIPGAFGLRLTKVNINGIIRFETVETNDIFFRDCVFNQDAQVLELYRNQIFNNFKRNL